MLCPPSWTSQVTASPALIETSLGENESFLTTTLAGMADAGAAAASAATTASAGSARCFDMGGEPLSCGETTWGASARSRHFPLLANRALGHVSSAWRG